MVSGFALVRRHIKIGTATRVIYSAGVTLTLLAGGAEYAHAQPATTATRAADAQDTSTDFLSDDGWRSLSREQRRERARRSMIARYVPDGGAPSVDDVDQYIEKFGDLTVYDPRHYLYEVNAEHLGETTGSIRLTGEVYPQHYKNGVQDALESLGFNVTANEIQTLPQLDHGQKPYGVATTTVATLRREPRRRAEQVNSVPLGGFIRVLRTATAADVSTASSSSRRAPNADLLSDDEPGDWILAQTGEGYLGFARKADFEMRNDYQLPNGVLKFPLAVDGVETTVPAGTFVYGDPDAGWRLFNEIALPSGADIADVRPQFTAEQIEKLMQPFMETRYVWGGVTDEGIDCSGFSQFFMRASGVMLPRDAVQQATMGLIVAWGEDVMEKALPGDLVFFANSSGRISHVAISLGGPQIIHSAGKGVHLARLDEKRDEDDDDIYGDRVIFARRVAAK